VHRITNSLCQVFAKEQLIANLSGESIITILCGNDRVPITQAECCKEKEKERKRKRERERERERENSFSPEIK